MIATCTVSLTSTASTLNRACPHQDMFFRYSFTILFGDRLPKDCIYFLCCKEWNISRLFFKNKEVMVDVKEQLALKRNRKNCPELRVKRIVCNSKQTLANVWCSEKKDRVTVHVETVNRVKAQFLESTPSKQNVRLWTFIALVLFLRLSGHFNRLQLFAGQGSKIFALNYEDSRRKLCIVYIWCRCKKLWWGHQELVNNTVNGPRTLALLAIFS